MHWTKPTYGWWVGWAILMLVGGCGKSEPESVAVEQLPYARQTQHAELRAELDRLVAEKATPELFAAAHAPAGTGSLKAVAAEFMRQLNEVCPPQDLQLAEERISSIYPSGAFEWDPLRLERARQFSERYAVVRGRYRELFGREDLGCPLSLGEGLLADLTCLDHARIAHRLEALLIADILSGGDVVVAIFPLRKMFHLESQLSAAANVAARSLSAELRCEALAIVAALVKHPQCSTIARRELLSLLESQLEAWTPDRVIWESDRALGLHAYELVRDGQLMNLLTAQEIAQLEQDGELSVFERAVRQSLDEDQWFYLSTMRSVIEACDLPYYERLPLFDQINQAVANLENTARYPLFAARVLLPNIGAVQRELAVERANCEAWVVAMRAAAGKPIELAWKNPLTGKPYDLVRELDVLRVKDLDPRSDSRWSEVVVPIDAS